MIASYPKTAADLWPNLSPIARTTGTAPHSPFDFGLHRDEEHSYWARLAERMADRLQVHCDTGGLQWAADWEKIGQRQRGLWDRAIELAAERCEYWYLADSMITDDRPYVIVLGCNVDGCQHTIQFGTTYSDGRPAAYAVLTGETVLECPACEIRAELGEYDPAEDDEDGQL